MKKFVLIVCCFFFVSIGFTQSVSQKLQKAWQQFQSDSQLKHAISSLYIIDAKTGQVVFDKNSQIGLAPASTQKIITAATAFELLGKDYHYKTEIGIIPDTINSVYVKPSGDPTFGSWRWNETKEINILNKIKNNFKPYIKKTKSTVYVYQKGWDNQSIPDGWIWQDIGNYYGAGAGAINWRENQFDLLLKSGSSIGDNVAIVKTNPDLYSYKISSWATSAKAGSGDNAYIYFSTSSSEGIVRGTIPINENKFEISGAMANPPNQFVETLRDTLFGKDKPYNYLSVLFVNEDPKAKLQILYTHYSPSLDSIIYWFLKKSVNLYGEALIKTFAYEKDGFGSTDGGVKIVKDFWKQKGIDEDELNISDGSGLSPQNRVTTHAQVEILKYAKGKDWFPYFYDGLPDYNGMKMKSGTIKDVKGFCGYHTAKDGKEYIFSFLVNNYNGRTSGVVGKMYKVLDKLK